MEKGNLIKVLVREEYWDLISAEYCGKEKILVTGAGGSIGAELVRQLRATECNVIATDIDVKRDISYCDVTNDDSVYFTLKMHEPDIIINIAGAKHAPLGETEIEETLKINTIGVMNILKYKKKETKLIQCSTCKANNPETVYGASKMIAERLVLNAGGSVARFFNVVETSGNVFEIWKYKEIIEVAYNCQRHFISLAEAVGLLIKSIDMESGRYIVNAPALIPMGVIAEALYPNHPKKEIEQRRGDRTSEVWMATNERIVQYLFNKSICKILNSHDAH